MSILSDIDKATSRRAIIFFLTLILFFAPGIMTLFVFFPELFESLETLKVLMLSTAFTMPAFLVVFLVAGTKMAESMGSNDDFHFHSATMSSMLTALAIYIALGISYWLGYSFNKFLLVELGVTIAITIIGLLVAFLGKSEVEGEKK